MEKYLFLHCLKQRNETLFYNMLLNHGDEILPIVDTRQVQNTNITKLSKAGEACVKLGPAGRIGEGNIKAIIPKMKGCISVWMI